MQSANNSPSEKKRKRSVFTKSVSSGQLNTSVQNGHLERQNSCVSFIDLPYVIDSPDLIRPISLTSLPKFKSLYKRSNSVAACSPIPALTRSNGSFSKMASRRNSSGNFRQLSESLVSQKQYTRPLSARTNSSGFFENSAETLPGDTRVCYIYSPIYSTKPIELIISTNTNLNCTCVFMCAFCSGNWISTLSLALVFSE
ncbi:hypothetical protein SNE40_012229 [Patella caerulea]|uniref:Uncharacterized protein n=1 Tax=Patella caerulea TaxID=87958 RepID=A0AAN8JRY9_PATCE